MDDRLHDKCGVFGIYGKGLDAARLTYFGLFALQHRGQESSGISASNSKKISIHKGMGLVTQVYKEHDFDKLKGFIAIGQNRYSTSGGTHDAHIQPVGSIHDIVTIAHNGNLPETKNLEKFLSSKGILTRGLNDTELIHQIIRYYLVKGLTIEKAIKKSFPLFIGSFCLLVMTKNKIVAVRDRYGIRPFSLGKLNGGYVFSSETCAIDTVNGKYIRDINPGEMVVVGPKGLTSFQLEKPKQKLDIFEFIYFSRPDSILLGKQVHTVRKNLGIQLSKEVKIKADLVIPVPDSAIPAAIAYSSYSGIPIDFGLVKNRYIGRTFILPDQRLRDRGVQMKLNPVIEIIKGKKVIVIDDSIVRGTTAKKLVTMIRQAGAKEVHILSSCPPIKFPDFYGIDTPTQKELIAANKSISQIENYIGADSLHFLSYEGMIHATELSENVFCTSCFTGEYPIDIGNNAKKIKYDTKKRIAVLISDVGTGTNLQAIIDNVENKTINAEIAIVISDTQKALGLKRAMKYNLPIKIVPKKEKLLESLKKYNLDFICLAGWKQIITKNVIDVYPNKILNMHPGLIPDSMESTAKNPDGTPALWNKGKMTNKAIKEFLEKRATYAGSSVHFLTHDFDYGPVLGRCFEKIEPRDTIDSLYSRLKVKENKLYVEVLRNFVWQNKKNITLF